MIFFLSKTDISNFVKGAEQCIFVSLPTHFVLSSTYIFAPGEYEGGKKRRATDPVWSLEIFEPSHSKVSPDQPVMYYLSGGPKRSFVREELQVVPEDSEAPPKKVK